MKKITFYQLPLLLVNKDTKDLKADLEAGGKLISSTVWKDYIIYITENEQNNEPVSIPEIPKRGKISKADRADTKKDL